MTPGKVTLVFSVDEAVDVLKFLRSAESDLEMMDWAPLPGDLADRVEALISLERDHKESQTRSLS